MDTAVVASLIASCASLVTSGAVAIWVAQRRANVDIMIAQMRIDLDRELAELRAKTERELADQKTKSENRLQNAAESIALGLFNEYPNRTRSFVRFKARLGGFGDDEIRRMLLRIGAHQVKMPGGDEGWQLSSPQDTA